MQVQSGRAADWQAFADPTNNQVELQLAILKQYMTRASEYTIEDLLTVREQNDLIKTVKQKLDVGGRSNSFLTETDDVDTSKGRLLTESSTNKRIGSKELFGGTGNKFRLNTQGTEDIRVRRRQLSQTDLSSIMAEIEEKCSRDVHDAISQLVAQHRIQKDRLVNARRDETEANKLTRENALLRNQIAELHVKIKTLEGMLKDKDVQIRDVKKALNDRERTLVKTETSVLIKDKMLNQHLKSLLARTESLKKQEQAQKQERQYLDGIWSEIVDKLEARSPDSLASFKTTVLTKCKESLLKQRGILQQEQQHLDKQHLYIEKIISQLQGVAPDKQLGK